MPKTIRFRSIQLALTDKQEVLAAIEAEHPVRIATANPEFIEIASHHPAFKQSLENMTHVTIDGSGLLFALRFWSSLRRLHIHPKLYHGADLVHDLFEKYQYGQKSFFLLGGKPGVMAKAAQKLTETYPDLAIVGAEDGGAVSAKTGSVDKDLAQRIAEVEPDILLVGFGAPKQELWIDAAKNLPIPVMIGVGGTLDFLVSKKRAPKAFRLLHMEWLYRGFQEKGHWRRLLRAVVVFPLRSLAWISADLLSHRETQK